MREQRNRRIGTLACALVFVGSAALTTSALAQDRGACVTVAVPEAFTLPDGSLHAAGRIALCTHEVLNPSAGLHRIRVDGEGTTLVISRRAHPKEFNGGRPVVLFRRVPGQPLDLVGYVVPFEGRSWSYTMKHASVGPTAEVSTLAKTDPSSEIVTLMAANVK